MVSSATRGTLLLTGASGFVGRHTHGALVDAGWHVQCATRDVDRAHRRWPERDWVSLDVADEASVVTALEGCEAALYLIHGMASHEGDFR
jgi:uncharacterized protein YbjT (DUF2867 family)